MNSANDNGMPDHKSKAIAESATMLFQSIVQIFHETNNVDVIRGNAWLYHRVMFHFVEFMAKNSPDAEEFLKGIEKTFVEEMAEVRSNLKRSLN